MSVTVRPAAVAGLFYSAGRTALAAEVSACLDGVPPARAAGVCAPKAIVAPHAGYVYSGPVAAHAYARLAPLAGRVTRVVLLGPTHRVAVRGLAAPSVDAFETPLGRVPLDRGALARLGDLPQVVTSDAAHAHEHSLEVQLPFLQQVLGSEGWSLVPLAVGDASADEVAEVLERLWGGDETLVVVSSDLSHYLPYREAAATDRATVDRIVALDAAGLGHEQACGATPINGLLRVARRRSLAPRLLDLRNSGDTAGDRSRVVGYAAIAFEPAGDASASRRDTDTAANAGDDDTGVGAALLAQARRAIADAFGQPVGPAPAHRALSERGATFVTLRTAGELRGCIGTLEARRPLADDVQMNALGAAFRDPRFEPLRADEFDALEIEVSVLGEPEPLPALSEADACAALRPGIDGVVLEWRGHRATFLPQVWDDLPEPRAFLAALRRKAGLAADQWASDLRLARYTVRKYVEATREGVKT
jgi:AmmeMemoRadiSam system protein B/AmmeMemoRadiSam system protein A